MKIIEKLVSEGVIPYDIGTQLKEQFDAKVEGRVAEITEAFKTEMKAQNDKALASFMSLMKESSSKQIDAHKAMLESKVSDYMDLVVENFIDENKEALETKMNEERVNALLEGFQAMMLASGVELTHIEQELREDENSKESIAESKQKELDNLAEEVLELRKEIDFRKKKDYLYSKCENLSELQKQKLTEHAIKIGDRSEYEDFCERLDAMVESMLEVSKAGDAESIVESYNAKTGIFNKKNNADLLFGSAIFK